MSTADLDVGYEKSALDHRPFCGLATMSLIFGVLSFVALPVVGGLLAVIFGSLARSRIRESHAEMRGETVATIAMILGIVNIVLVAFFLVILSMRYHSSSEMASATMVASPPSFIATPAPFIATPTYQDHPALSVGVKMANEMGRADDELVQKLQLASKEDPVICIYNVSANSHEPEMAVLTGKRISYVKESRITPLQLTEIETILDHRKYMEKYQNNGFASDQFNIEIKGKDSTRMRIVIRPGVDGPSFFEALNDAWKAAGGETKPPATDPLAP